MDQLYFWKELIFVIAYWIVVPVILVGLILFGIHIMNNLGKDTDKISAKAGFWAGLLSFVIYSIATLPLLDIPNYSKSPYPQPINWKTGIGFLIGFFSLFIIRNLIKCRYLGLLVFILTLSGTWALYSHFFIENLNKWLFSASLGLGFGALFHLMFFPESVRNIKKYSKDSSSIMKNGKNN